MGEGGREYFSLHEFSGRGPPLHFFSFRLLPHPSHHFSNGLSVKLSPREINSPHLLPTSTGHPACLVLSSPSPLRFKFHQKAASPWIGRKKNNSHFNRLSSFSGCKWSSYQQRGQNEVRKHYRHPEMRMPAVYCNSMLCLLWKPEGDFCENINKIMATMTMMRIL